MKRTPLRAKCFSTASVTSTTGPHVRLVQNFGVAKTSTNGACALSESATEYRRRGRSGGLAVVKAARSPWVLASVGVRDGIARSPTAGACGRFATFRIAKPWIGAPSGWATIVYVTG